MLVYIVVYIAFLLITTHGIGGQISFSSIPCKNRSPRIVGGIETEKHELPFIVSLTRRGGHFCGATIIHESWSLTAGHCTCNGLNKFMKATQIQGVLGLHSISKHINLVRSSQENPSAVKINFKYIVPHPKYSGEGIHINHSPQRCLLFPKTSSDPDPNLTSYDKHDNICYQLSFSLIEALLKLERSVRLSINIQPTCLPLDTSKHIDENTVVTVFGWGWTDENQEIGQRSDILRKANVKVWSNKQCEKSYQLNGNPNTLVPDTQICAGIPTGGVDSCWADSGGPLISKEYVLIGIVSTGVGCGRPGLPGIYTRVSKYITWIESIILYDNNYLNG